MTTQPGEAAADDGNNGDLDKSANLGGRLRAHLTSKKWIALGVIMLVLLGAGLAAMRIRGNQSGARTIDGSITLGVGAWTYNESDLVLTGLSYTTDGRLLAGTECTAVRGYDDVDENSQVRITNEAGATIATAALSTGHTDIEAIVKRYSYGVPTKNAAAGCVFVFTATDVPNAKFYTVEIGDRKGLTYSYDEMVSMGWKPGFTLG